MKFTKNIGMLLLAISGALPLLKVSFNGELTVMAVLAIVAGVFILIGR